MSSDASQTVQKPTEECNDKDTPPYSSIEVNDGFRNSDSDLNGKTDKKEPEIPTEIEERNANSLPSESGNVPCAGKETAPSGISDERTVSSPSRDFTVKKVDETIEPINSNRNPSGDINNTGSCPKGSLESHHDHVIVISDSDTPQSTVTSYSQVYDTVSSEGQLYNTVDSQTILIRPGRGDQDIKRRSRVSWSFENPAASDDSDVKVKIRKHDDRPQMDDAEQNGQTYDTYETPSPVLRNKETYMYVSRDRRRSSLTFKVNTFGRQPRIITSDVVPTPPKKEYHLCTPKHYGLKLFLSVLFFIIVGGVSVIWIVYEKQLYQSEIDRKVFFNPIGREFRILKGYEEREVLLEGILGKYLPRKFVPRYCDVAETKNVCVDYKGYGTLNVKYKAYKDDVACYEVDWRGASPQSSLTDCFQLQEANWYGGPLAMGQTWPTSRENHSSTPYVTGDIYRGAYGPIAERYVLASTGVALLIKRTSPISIGINSKTNEICVTANFIDQPYTAINKIPSLGYRICQANNIRLVHEFMINNFIPKPYISPSEEFFRVPRWSTWGTHGMNTTQRDVITLAKRLTDLKFTGNIIVVPDGWQDHHGDIEFHKVKFPYPKRMITDLQDLGYQLELWVFPVVNTDSIHFAEGMNNDYFVKTLADNVPGLMSWYHGFGACIDTVYPKAVQWFVDRLEKFQNTYGIKAFHFGGGEVDNLPHQPVFHKPVLTPNTYSTNYARIASLFGPYAQVEVGSRTQNLSSIIHIANPFPIWGKFNGIQSIIPTVLTLGLHGYPFFVLPVGTSGDFEREAANTYNITIPDKPTKELYIRWLQIATFLPAFQFSTVPWEYDGETVHIAHKMIELHQKFVLPKVMDLARNINVTGLPIIRPMWWRDPTNAVAQKVSDQFLLGNDIIVAPMVNPGTVRDIYLPKGFWKDIYGATYRIYSFGSKLTNYSVPLDRIPYFICVRNC